MTSRTHDLAAITLVSFRFLSQPPEGLTQMTVLGIGVATILGGLIPDIDNMASPAWKHRLMPWESRTVTDFLQGHRHLSHSLVGAIIFTLALGWLLKLTHIIGLDISVVQQAFFLSIISHLLMDSLTVQGVPWLFPIPVKFGFPPLSFLRIKSGSWLERLVVFPLLLISLVIIYYLYRQNLILIIQRL